jgi:transposase-like protein
MAKAKRLPTNLMEAIRYFADPAVCIEFVADLRWPDGPTCPRCGSQEHSFLSTRSLWKCKACKKQYSVKAGTIFEDSPLPLDKWLCAIWLIANSKNGVSSHELGRSIGITQKSAWFVNHRIRLAMMTGTFESFDGTVEVDETFIGGRAKYMHKRDRDRKIGPKGKVAQGNNKTIVVGAIERGGRVTTKIIPDARAMNLEPIIFDNVIQGSVVYTDHHHGYKAISQYGAYEHHTVNHSNDEYVRGDVHTNTIENFWSVVKRALHGTYISVEPFHLFRYMDERVFCFNERHRDDQGRFLAVLAMVSGRRLTYAELTGKC